jgi:hypothetical protein
MRSDDARGTPSPGPRESRFDRFDFLGARSAGVCVWHTQGRATGGVGRGGETPRAKNDPRRRPLAWALT